MTYYHSQFMVSLMLSLLSAFDKYSSCDEFLNCFAIYFWQFFSCDKREKSYKYCPVVSVAEFSIKVVIKINIDYLEDSNHRP